MNSKEKKDIEIMDVFLKTKSWLCKNQCPIDIDINYSNDNKNMPTFSVIMPTYNRAYCITNAIESLLNQTYNKFELIIIDDGSTDGTEKLIKKQYKREINIGIIKYFKLNKVGVSAARNKGLKESKNEWIAYLDSDNYLCPDFLEAFSNEIMLHPERNAFNAKLIRVMDRCVVGDQYDKETVIEKNTVDIGCYINRRIVFEELGGFDEEMSRFVDWDLIVRYSKNYEPLFIDRVVMLYNDSNEEDRITNDGNKYFLNLNKFKMKNCEYPLVTTIIISYNHEKYIRQAIDSALAQRGDFVHEIIISDDASSDSTHEIIKEYTNLYPGLIIDISNEKNKGISANYKKCFNKANGKYIAILEGDDYWVDSRKIDKQVKFLEENDDCSMVFGGIKLLDGGTIKDHKNRKNIKTNKITGYDLFKVGIDIIANYSCCMYRKNIICNIPNSMYKNRLSEIALTFYNEKKGKIGYISDIMSVYRINENGVWSSASKLDKLKQKKMVREQALDVCADYYKEEFKSIIDKIDSEIERVSLNEKAVINKQLEIIRKSAYFNPMWYREKYLLDDNIDPAEHYLKKGLYETNPSEKFNGEEYLQLNLDVEKCGINPLLHYEQYGKREKRILNWNEALVRYFGEEVVPAKKYINNEPYISVIVLCENNGDQIISCLDKLLNQKYSNYEVIIFDNASIDNSCEQIESYIADNESDILIRFYSTYSNMKYSKAEVLKLVVEKAKGSYVAFCEARDLWEKSHLEEVCKFIQKSEYHARIIVNDVDVFGDINAVMPVCRRRVEVNKKFNSCIKRIIPKELQIKNYILSISSVCVRRDVLLSCDYNVVGMPEEIEWWLWRQICFDTPIFYINKQLSKIRRVDVDKVVQRGRVENQIANQDFVDACNAVLLKKYKSAAKLLEQNINISSSQEKTKVQVIDQVKETNAKNIVDNTSELKKRAELESRKRKELESTVTELNAKVKELNTTINETRSSFTYKIARKITFFPRLIRHALTNYGM